MEKSTSTASRIRAVRIAISALAACLIAAGADARAQGAPAPGKRAAVGILYLADFRPDRGGGERSPFDNPAVDGLILRTAWMMTEPQSGSYEWSAIDRLVQEARRSGKIFALGIGAGFRSPEWFMRSGAMTISTETADKGRGRAVMPVPWDPAFLRKWGELLQAAAARYDAEPSVAYIMIAGLGRSFEPFMARSPEDLRAFEAMGGLPKWIEGSKAVIDLYAKYFRNTPFILTTHFPTGRSPEGERAILEVMDYGFRTYPGRFGIRFTGLDAVASTSFIFHRAIAEWSGRAPVGYQMAWSSQGPNAKMLRGSLEDALARGAALKAHFIEVYAVDCDNPQYSQALRQTSAALRANAAEFLRR